MAEQTPQPELNETELIEQWLGIGRSNLWIRAATDPPFTRDSLHKCETLDELQERLRHGNWCLGQGFYHRDLCFINQVEGGDEWLTLKQDIAFESFTFGAIEQQGGPGAVREMLERLLRATKEQCKDWTY